MNNIYQQQFKVKIILYIGGVKMVFNFYQSERVREWVREKEWCKHNVYKYYHQRVLWIEFVI